MVLARSSSLLSLAGAYSNGEYKNILSIYKPSTLSIYIYIYMYVCVCACVGCKVSPTGGASCRVYLARIQMGPSSRIDHANCDLSMAVRCPFRFRFFGNCELWYVKKFKRIAASLIELHSSKRLVNPNPKTLAQPGLSPSRFSKVSSSALIASTCQTGQYDCKGKLGLRRDNQMHTYERI